MTPSFLTVWVIYRSPLDHPGKFVVRAQDVTNGNPEPVPRKGCLVCDSLTEARAVVPPHLHRLDRHPDDEPSIVETWM